MEGEQNIAASIFVFKVTTITPGKFSDCFITCRLCAELEILVKTRAPTHLLDARFRTHFFLTRNQALAYYAKRPLTLNIF